MHNHLYSQDKNLTKKVEKTLKKEFVNRSIIEGVTSGTFLTTTYLGSIGIEKSLESIQNDNDLLIKAIAGTSALTTASIIGAYTTANAARKLDSKRFALGALTVPLFAAWITAIYPESNVVDPIINHDKEPTLEINH